jgi:molybdate transport repressor ModE-like protein
MENNLGIALLETEVGGPGGGGAVLTRQAKGFIDRFRMFERGLESEIERRFLESFGTFDQK